MGRAVNPPYSLKLALFAALGFGACMPSEVEVGRDAALEVAEAGVGGRAPVGRSSGGTQGSMDGGEPAAPDAGRGGSGGSTAVSCPVPGSQEAAWTLEMFCSNFTCPTSADGAKDLLARSFEGCPGLANEVRTGCGLSQISVTTETQSDTFVYAEDTRALVGATIHHDHPWGPCNVFRYYAGVNANGCQATTACAFCGEMATCP